MFDKMFREITHDKLAAKQLNDAKIQLLEAEAHREYYVSMCEMLTTRVARLESINAPKAVTVQALRSVPESNSIEV